MFSLETEEKMRQELEAWAIGRLKNSDEMDGIVYKAVEERFSSGHIFLSAPGHDEDLDGVDGVYVGFYLDDPPWEDLPRIALTELVEQELKERDKDSVEMLERFADAFEAAAARLREVINCRKSKVPAPEPPAES